MVVHKKVNSLGYQSAPGMQDAVNHRRRPQTPQDILVGYERTHRKYKNNAENTAHTDTRATEHLLYLNFTQKQLTVSELHYWCSCCSEKKSKTAMAMDGKVMGGLLLQNRILM